MARADTIPTEGFQRFANSGGAVRVGEDGAHLGNRIPLALAVEC